MGKLVEEFNDYRSRMNERVMETANTNIKRFFALDTFVISSSMASQT